MELFAYFAYSAVLPSLASSACTGSQISAIVVASMGEVEERSAPTDVGGYVSGKMELFRVYREPAYFSISAFQFFFIPLPSPALLRQHQPLLVRLPRNRLSPAQTKRRAPEGLQPPQRLLHNPGNPSLAGIAELGKNPV